MLRGRKATFQSPCNTAAYPSLRVRKKGEMKSSDVVERSSSILYKYYPKRLKIPVKSWFVTQIAQGVYMLLSSK
jgi:hypothetical protein